MILKITLVLLLLLVISYLAGLPLYKKRPILITEKSALILISILFLITAPTWKSVFILWFIIFGIAFLLILITNFWVTIGITKNNILEALNKTLSGTQTKSEPSSTGVRLLEPVGAINLHSIVGSIVITTFHLDKTSKKHKLIKNVLRKFIDNYHFNL